MSRNTCMATLLLALWSLPALAEPEWQWQLSPRVGHSLLRIDAFEGVNNDDEDSDGIEVGGTFGLLTPIGVVLEAGAMTQGNQIANLDWWGAVDQFELESQRVALGYQIELGEGWRLVPKVGRVRWKFFSEEGELANPGPEDETTLRGYDYFWEIAFARQVSDVVALGAAYQDTRFEFGSARTVSFVVTFGFGQRR